MENDMNQKRQPVGSKDGGQWVADVNAESTVVLSDEPDRPTGTAYAEAHALYERGGRALTDRQPSLEQAHIHAQLASDYTKASANAGGSGTYLGHRHELAAKSHNSATKAWQRLYDRKGEEASAINASQRAAESGRKASDEASASDAINESVASKPAGRDLTALKNQTVADLDVRVRPDGMREWYKNGEFVPPPIGTEINVAEARALPSYVEVMSTFDVTGDREFRLMARDLPRYSDEEHPTDSRLSRRFTNLDTGFEVFVGGNGGMNSTSSTVNLTKIRVSAHG